MLSARLTIVEMSAGDKAKRGAFAMGEEHCSERAGHGWPAQDLQAKRDAKAPQGKSSAQGRVHSALAGLVAGKLIVSVGRAGKAMPARGVASGLPKH
ncbi:hypothetical protein HHA01_24750 [Halomonas halmophila]|uniref:Uncharacterized protein n=1 Tax=Halomonas halmophila TaxID=252 RepID=A0A4Y4F8P5_9GAMM|nr:hypothetical protein HHA01_24750 [Halomonas halmophila]